MDIRYEVSHKSREILLAGSFVSSVITYLALENGYSFAGFHMAGATVSLLLTVIFTKEKS